MACDSLNYLLITWRKNIFSLHKNFYSEGLKIRDPSIVYNVNFALFWFFVFNKMYFGGLQCKTAKIPILALCLWASYCLLQFFFIYNIELLYGLNELFVKGLEQCKAYSNFTYRCSFCYHRDHPKAATPNYSIGMLS